MVTRLWHRHRGRRWHSALELGLPPIASALVLASAFTVLRASPEGGAAWIIAALGRQCSASAQWNPLLVLMLGGLAGVLVARLG